jgi:hypothetical protein
LVLQYPAEAALGVLPTQGRTKSGKGKYLKFKRVQTGTYFRDFFNCDEPDRKKRRREDGDDEDEPPHKRLEMPPTHTSAFKLGDTVDNGS